MSITVDFAFNATGNLAAVHASVNSAIGVTLQPYEGDSDDLFGRLFGLELSLSTANHLKTIASSTSLAIATCCRRGRLPRSAL